MEVVDKSVKKKKNQQQQQTNKSKKTNLKWTGNR